MRIAFGLLTLTLFLSTACQDKKFAGATKAGAADSKPEPVVPSEPSKSANEIEFGKDEVYRIGDGISGVQSACISEVTSHDLKGRVYYFEFEVLEDAATVDISIGKLCGVDGEGSTKLSLQDSAKAILGQEVTVPTDASGSRATPYLPIGSQKLNKGTYSVVISSMNTKGKADQVVDPNADEFDDFVVGKIHIKSDKTVKLLGVSAE